MRLVMCAAVALAAGPTVAEDPKVEEAKIAKAKIDAQTIEKAVKTYYVKNEKWPAKLDDVAELLEGGKKALTDSWGKAYRFEIGEVNQPDGTVIERPYVWTERVVNGKTEVYGNKPPEVKKDEKKP